jgi:quinol monooxygenase YgiN
MVQDREGRVRRDAMRMIRQYVMQAREGQEVAMLAALQALAVQVRAVAGSEGVDLLRDRKNSRRFVFLEKWHSVEAHAASASAIPKTALAPIMAAIEGAPAASDLEYI